MKKFYTDTRVLYADTDAMGVVYHGRYIVWFELGRTEFLREIGFPYTELEKLPFWLPVTVTHCEYKSPGRYDDLLEIATWPSKLTFATVQMSYEIRRKETGGLLVTGYTEHAITDDKLRPIRAKKVCPEAWEATMDIIRANEAE